ncbi:MAG: LOG family protein [Anaerolineales bacterium]
MPKIASVFGGSAPQPGSPPYEEARRLGALLARSGWTVATGGYSGVMAAASHGACEAGGHVVGVTCELIETWRDLRANEWVKEEIRFRTLRERLYHLVEFCDAALAMPGGIGTLSEIALIWSLMQINEIRRKPFVVIGRVWGETISTFIRESDGYLHPGDNQLIQIADNVEEAVRHIADSR